jgi:hypothetical protein
MKKRTRRVSRRAPALLALTLVFVCTAALSLPQVKAQVVASPAAPSAEDAVQLGVERLGLPYAGSCSTAHSPDDLGKTCSKLVAQQGDRRAYVVGRTFAEFDEWMFVDQTPTGWLPVTVVPFDDSANALVVPWPQR